jgi:hypothetical protein
LTNLGPRLWPLLVMSATTMGLAGLLTGVALAIVRHVRARRSGRQQETEPTPLLDPE